MWPFNRTETRNYTDARTDAAIAEAEGTYAGLAAVVEAHSAALSRSFASVTANGDRAEAIPPWLLAWMGRQVGLQGGFVCRIDVSSDGIRLVPGTGSIEAGAGLPETWIWTWTEAGAASSRVYRLRDSEVVRYCSGGAPWEIRAGWRNARIATDTVARFERSLRDESNIPTIALVNSGYTDQQAINKFFKLLADARGKVVAAVAEMGTRRTPVGGALQTSSRIGPAPPEGVIAAYKATRIAVADAVGFPIMLTEGQTGPLVRELFRQWTVAHVAPMVRLLEAELRHKLNSQSLALGLDGLGGMDLSGRSRAMEALIDAGASFETAARAVGLPNLEPDSLGGMDLSGKSRALKALIDAGASFESAARAVGLPSDLEPAPDASET